MYGWKQGLKTGSYYIRTAPAADMQAFTLEPSKTQSGNYTKNLDSIDSDNKNDNKETVWKCTMENGCEMCGS